MARDGDAAPWSATPMWESASSMESGDAPLCTAQEVRELLRRHARPGGLMQWLKTAPPVHFTALYFWLTLDTPSVRTEVLSCLTLAVLADLGGSTSVEELESRLSRLVAVIHVLAARECGLVTLSLPVGHSGAADWVADFDFQRVLAVEGACPA